MDNTPPADAGATNTDALDKAIRDQGVEPYEDQQVDYFDTGGEENVPLPDGKSFITIKVMNEGDRLAYQKGMDREVRVQKQTGDAIMKLSPAEERHALLRACITGWDLIRKGDKVPFTAQNLKAFMSSAPTKIIDKIEAAAREFNPWLLAEMTVEDIDAEMERLVDLREEVAKREAGKAD